MFLLIHSQIRDIPSIDFFLLTFEIAFIIVTGSVGRKSSQLPRQSSADLPIADMHESSTLSAADAARM